MSDGLKTYGSGKLICNYQDDRLNTGSGTVALRNLATGDMLWSADGMTHPVSWIGKRSLSLAEGDLDLSLQPVMIRKNALGQGMPERDTLVSPEQRLMLDADLAQSLFGCDRVLVAARYLLGRPGVEIWVQSHVDYMHFHCRGRDLIALNGLWLEMTNPAGQGDEGAGGDAELLDVFPELFSAASRAQVQIRHDCQDATPLQHVW